jgi:hypothetical protein
MVGIRRSAGIGVGFGKGWQQGVLRFRIRACFSDCH